MPVSRCPRERACLDLLVGGNGHAVWRNGVCPLAKTVSDHETPNRLLCVLSALRLANLL